MTGKQMVIMNLPFAGDLRQLPGEQAEGEMAEIPAHCRHCGAVFYIDNFIGGPSGGVRLSGITTPCRICGRAANIADGTFNLLDNALYLIDGPPLTRLMIERLKGIAEAAKEKAADAEALLAEIADVNPDLAEALRKRGLPYFVITLILIWLFKSVTLNVTVDLNRLIDHAEAAATSSGPAQLLDAPVPSATPGPNELEHSTLVGTQGGPVSRQLRRQLERQARKPTGRGEQQA